MIYPKTNTRYLASLIADIPGRDFDEIIGYMHKLKDVENLKQHIENKTKESGMFSISDTEARFGMRTGCYAFVRVLKPKVVVETGVDKRIRGMHIDIRLDEEWKGKL